MFRFGQREGNAIFKICSTLISLKSLKSFVFGEVFGNLKEDIDCDDGQQVKAQKVILNKFYNYHRIRYTWITATHVKISRELNM